MEAYRMTSTMSLEHHQSNDFYSEEQQVNSSKSQPIVISSGEDPSIFPQEVINSPTLSTASSRQFPVPIVLTSKPDDEESPDEMETFNNDDAQLAQNGSNSLKQKSPDWSTEELDTLIKPVQVHGTNWRRVMADPVFRSMFKPERTPLSLKTKWFRVKASPAVVSVLGPPRKKSGVGEEIRSSGKYPGMLPQEGRSSHGSSKSKNVEFSNIQKVFARSDRSKGYEPVHLGKRKHYEDSSCSNFDERISSQETFETISEKDNTDIDKLYNDDSAPSKKKSKLANKSGRSLRGSKSFQIEKILQHRFLNENLEFLVRWKNHSDSWEPLQVLPRVSLQKLLLPLYYSDGEGMSLKEICKIAQFVVNH